MFLRKYVFFLREFSRLIEYIVEPIHFTGTKQLLVYVSRLINCSTSKSLK